MTWLKPKAAAKAWAGDVSVKLLYRAIAEGKLKSARVGAGRNLLVCEQFVTDWLLASADPRVSGAITHIKRSA